MKKWGVIIFLLCAFQLRAQTITCIAGNGTGGDGTLAISASVNDPNYTTFDSYGNLYFSEPLDNKIRKIDTAGIITTIAGSGATGFSGDSGLATAAKLHEPAGLAIDNVGNVFFADVGNNRIRKIEAASGIITTIAGNATAGFAGDSGLASEATLYQPSGLCLDRLGNLYVGDYGNHRIRKINTSGIITSVAGNGSVGWGGNGGLATAAMISPSAGISVDTLGNLYISEWTYGVVRKVDTAGIITLIAGDTSSHIYNGDGILATNAHLDPFFAAVDDSGIIYLADTYNNRIRKIDASGIIYTVAGTGIGGNTGDNGPAETAEIHTPAGIGIDRCGNVYFGQVNVPRIRKITFDSACSNTVHNVGTPNITANFIFNVYPNPAHDELTIIGNAISKVTISNTIGQSLLSKDCNTDRVSVDISTLPSGIYLVQVIQNNGVQVINKIIKE